MAEQAPERLPRGRHQLTRTQVADAQRDRMMLALADAMTEKGYVNTTVADVLSRAGVSRETFYQQFSSKLDCFMHTFDAAAEVLFAHVGDVSGGSGSPHERFELLFSRYLETLAAEPAYARLFLVEVYAAGPAAIERRAAMQARIVDALADVLEIDSERDRFACQMVVAAVSAMVTVPLVARDLDALRALHAPVLDFVRRALAG